MKEVLLSSPLAVHT